MVTSQCPDKNDRQDAWYNNKKCRSRNTCCFDETYIDPGTFNVTTINCCYEYGTDGAIKCCGYEDNLIFLTALIPFMVAFFLIIICLQYIGLIQLRKYCNGIQEKDVDDLGENDDKIVQLDTITN